MRLITYNILDGGEGRADPLAEVIEAQSADIVALVEATDMTVIQRIANRLNMDYIHAPGAAQASALLTRWTIRESINHALTRNGLSKSLLEATVIEPGGQEWTLGVLHLHHDAAEAGEQIRERELAVVLDTFKGHPESRRPHILTGDFNANAPSQKLMREKLKPTSQTAWDANGNRIPRRVIQRMLDEGYVDTLATLHPEQAAVTGTLSTQFPGQRVDYIFAHGFDRSRITAAWIEQDRLAKYASDHFPVGVEIR